MVLSTISQLLFSLSCAGFLPSTKLLLYSSIIFGGFVCNGTLPLLFELAMECVYPVGGGIAEGTIVLRHSFHAGKTSNLSPDKSPLVNENRTINSSMTPSIALRSVAAQFNEYFTSIAQEFKPLMQVHSPPNVISSDLLVSPEEVLSDLRILPSQKAVGPDRISNKLSSLRILNQT